MKMRASYRRDVIEEILDIKVFASMNLLLRSKQQDLTKEITTLRHQVDLIENKVDLQEKHYNESISNRRFAFYTVLVFTKKD